MEYGSRIFYCERRSLFSELSPRPHDTEMVTLYTQSFNQFELYARAILDIPVLDIPLL